MRITGSLALLLTILTLLPVASAHSSCVGQIKSALKQVLSLRQEITPEEARRQFVLMRKIRTSSHDLLPFCVTRAACESRAHRMAIQLEENGIDSSKIFAVPVRKNPFDSLAIQLNRSGTVRSDTAHGGWNYHVALIVRVKQPDGSVKEMVFDPSLYSAPVEISVWRDRMLTGGNEVSFSTANRFTFHPKDTASPPSSWRDEDWIQMENILAANSTPKARYEGQQQSLKNRWINRLEVRDPEAFREIQNAMRNPKFRKWWSEPITADRLQDFAAEGRRIGDRDADELLYWLEQAERGLDNADARIKTAQWRSVWSEIQRSK